MHRFANKFVLFRLRLAALLYLLFFFSCLGLPFVVGWGILFNDSRGLQASFVLLPTAFLSGILFLMVSSGVRCPLCRGQVLRRHGATAVNSKARPLFGSYRLRVICGLFFAGQFRCFHCGEPCDALNPRR